MGPSPPSPSPTTVLTQPPNVGPGRPTSASTSPRCAVGQLAPVVEALTAALSNTRMGEAHIDFLARGLATTCRGQVPALEKLYGVDFRASVDATGNALNGGDWKMETDNDYDVAADCLDAAKLKACTQTMGKCSVCGKTTPCACSTTQVTLKHSAYRQLYGGEG